MTVLIPANIPSALPAPSCRPYQRIIPPSAVAATSLAVINYSYIPYVLRLLGTSINFFPTAPCSFEQLSAAFRFCQSTSLTASSHDDESLFGSYSFFECPKSNHPQPVLFHSSVSITAISKAKQSLSVTVPSFLYFTLADPRQYALLKMALIHFLPHDESEQFKYHVLLDHFEA